MTAATQNLVFASENTKVLMSVMLFASIGLRLLVESSGSQTYMIGMLNSLQLVIHLPLMKV